MVHDLEKRVQAAKNNVESMSQLMTKWCEAPLYERKEGKKEGLLNIEVKVMRRHSFEKLRRLRNFMRVLQLLSEWSKCSDEIFKQWVWIVGIILLLIISQDSETNLNKRYSLIQQSGERIHELMKVYLLVQCYRYMKVKILQRSKILCSCRHIALVRLKIVWNH